MSKAHAPYSKFAVGVAIKCKSGAVFLGASIENRSFARMICAERVAIGAAVAAGEGHFVPIAVTSDSHQSITPYRGHLQFLAEFNPDLIIVSATGRGDRKIDSPSRFLPDLLRGIPKNADLS